MHLSDAEEYYQRIGFSQRVGLGSHPALLVVDMNHGCADPAVSPLGIPMEAEIANISRLLDCCRAKDFPVIYTTVVYTEERLRDGAWFVRKVPALEALRRARSTPRSCPSSRLGPASWCWRSASPVASTARACTRISPRVRRTPSS
jgi:hypothetical protein